MYSLWCEKFGYYNFFENMLTALITVCKTIVELNKTVCKIFLPN